MTTTTKPEPASDADLAVVRPLGYRCIGCVLGTPPETHGSACIFAMEPRLIARIEVDRAQIKRCHAIMQGLVSYIDPEEADKQVLDDAEKELSGKFCPGSCTTSCDADRDADRARIRELEEEIERLRSLLYSSKPWPILKEKL